MRPRGPWPLPSVIIERRRYPALAAGALALCLLFGARAMAQERAEPSLGELVNEQRFDEIRSRFDQGLPPEAILLAAVRFDSLDALRLAFESGADPAGLQASRAYLRARRQGHEQAAELLAEAGVDLEGRDPLGRTLLILAVQEGEVPDLRHLISEGADVDARSNVGITALMEAVISGRQRFVRTLVDAGAGVDELDRDGWTALAWAVRLENLEAVRFLLSRGADPNHVDRLGWTPLLLASAGSNPAIAHQLLASGASPNFKTPAIGSPLIRAVHGGNADIVNLLLVFGADRRPAFGGRTALEWAEALGRDEIAALLGRRGRRS